jgi:hypothetical protein
VGSANQMPQHHDILIRFLRKGAGGQARMNPATDDTLRIVKLGENSIRTIYIEKSSDGTVIDTSTTTYQGLLAYLYRVFYLLGLDEDPFASVQFFIPGYPTILVEVATLHANVHTLMELVMSTCWSWPSIGRLLSSPPVRHPE